MAAGLDNSVLKFHKRGHIVYLTFAKGNFLVAKLSKTF